MVITTNTSAEKAGIMGDVGLKGCVTATFDRIHLVKKELKKKHI